ncbi:HD-GYP domain-containing protein [Pseudomonadota bacterium]
MANNDQFKHQDHLAFLNKKSSLRTKLKNAHAAVQENLPFIARIALALYDSNTKILRTYLHSSVENNPLEHYETLIDNAPSLKEILNREQPRVINNMLTFEEHKGSETIPIHKRRLGRQGYAASYTVPIFDSGTFIGFLFFNSYETDVFTEQALHELDLHGHLISLMVINELNTVQTLSAIVKTTGNLTHHRDLETGSHLDRMSRYTRLIAISLADKYDLNDDYIEHVFMFSPLHDIGKIAIPDNILLKQGQLNDDEMQVMRTHPLKGRQIIDNMLHNFGLEHIDHTDIMRNIATFHHEAVNGTGYPQGKSGNEIPLEARMVAVADIFDALTSKRPYKEAWSNEQAFELLNKLAGETLDKDCVEALLNHQEEINTIQEAFREKAL